MNKISIGLFIPALLILFIQIFLLKNIEVSILGRYVMAILIYPVPIIMLPLMTPRIIVILLAFSVGIVIDFFYDTPGVHSSALLFTGLARGLVLKIMEPRSGYRTDNDPTATNYGVNWYLTYLGILLFTHIMLYFSVDAFSLVYWDRILVNGICSFAISYAIVILFHLLFRR